MPLVARVYVSTSSLGDLAACERQARELFVDLDDKTKAGLLTGYMSRIFTSAAEVQAEGLDVNALAGAAGKRYPLLFLNCTWEGIAAAPPAFLAALERTYALREITA
jgi:hypothetical protein